MEAKKNPKIALYKKTGLFLSIGFVISLMVVIIAFEWKTYDQVDLLDLGKIADDFEEITEVPLTRQPPPPPPTKSQPVIIEVPDEEEIEEEIDVDLDVEITEDTEIDEIVFEEPVEEEAVDEIFTIVEQNPTFKGGDAAFIGYIQKNLVYPEKARRMGLEGRVFVQFVVELDGSLSKVTVLRGIGGGCNEEAIKVMRNSPKWITGKQRGRPVRVQIVVPIIFKLQ
jgi:periplasmic protein TonB